MSTPGYPGTPPDGGVPPQSPQPPYPPAPPGPPSPPGSSGPPPGPPSGRASNGLGLAALIVGIVALVLAVIPILSFVAWVPALVAIGLAIGGLVVKQRARGTSIAGLVLGVVAIVVAIAVSIATAFGTVAFFRDVLRTATIGPLEPAPSPGATLPGLPGESASAPRELVYEVETDGATIASVVYATFAGGRIGQEDDSDVPAPFTARYELPGDGGFQIYSLVARAAPEATTITCRITVDDVVVAEQSASGPDAAAVCTASN